MQENLNWSFVSLINDSILYEVRCPRKYPLSRWDPSDMYLVKTMADDVQVNLGVRPSAAMVLT